MGWQEAWIYFLGLPEAAPQWAVALAALTSICFFVIVPFSFLVAFLERKLAADFQARIGPKLVGPFGILQPFSDVLKLLQKRRTHSRTFKEEFWFQAQSLVLYSSVAVLPLGSLSIIVDTDMSAFLPLLFVLMVSFAALLFGSQTSSVSTWLSGVRIASQSISGALPVFIALLAAGIHSGGFRWSSFVSAQGASPLDWAAFGNPFLFIAFCVFVMGGLVANHLAPFESGTSTIDIQGGVLRRHYGRRFSIFRMGKLYALFMWSVLAVVIFCGAWNLPEFFKTYLVESGFWMTLHVFEVFVLLTKTFVLMFLIHWVVKVNPKIRSDQITDLTFKVLGPFSLFALIGAALWSAGRSLL